MHPKLERLLHRVKGRDHMAAIRRLQLAAPGAVPKPCGRKWILLDQRLEVAKQNVRDREAVLITRNTPNDVRAELLRRHCRLCASLTGQNA